jgi:hypothetical protein
MMQILLFVISSNIIIFHNIMCVFIVEQWFQFDNH